jgi:hypothetical protein
MRLGVLKRRTERSEHMIQAMYFRRVRAKWPLTKLIYAVPNAAKRSYSLAAHMKGEGMTAGILDINIDIPRGGYHGMRIEFKRDAKMKFSEEQVKTVAQLEAEGYLVELHWDDVAAFDSTLAYMRGERILMAENAA